MENNYKGLSSKEVSELREKYGFNELTKEEKTSPIIKFLSVFKEPMFLLLVVAATLYFILGEPKEAGIMLIFVVFVASITFIQEWKTEQTMNALKDLTSPQVVTLRDNKKVSIKSCELVPGDTIFLAEGERIPADCKVIETSNFSVDESILTGESEHVFKISYKETSESKDYWKKDKLYAGTLSVFGQCIAEVELIGFDTEYGKIGKAIKEAKEEDTPLQRKVNKLVKNLAVAGAILCVLVVIVSYFYNGNVVQSILSGISLAMATIPEEFPVVLTVFLSMGAYRLAKKNTLMRKISAVETLGSTTVLCVDKTGTITQNRMKAKNFYMDKKILSVDEFNDEKLSNLMILSSEKNPYDPMEKALIESAKDNCCLEELYNMEEAFKIPFNSETKRMANIYKKNDKFYAATKGSAETILPLCNLNDTEINDINKTIDKMASKGLRILAFAECISDDLKMNLEDYKLNFIGLVGLQDPAKDGVKEAIALCKKAGIRVIMITGDYNKTAIAIGEEIGLKFSKKGITGDKINIFNDDELRESVKDCDIFSRVIPEHKMKIIKALKANGEIVAMTGDGVNDAPALKSADIGIAMGKRGTEVAKEAAHMILMDDNFTTIVNSVEDGRRVYDNIRKAMVYIMIIHIPIAAVALFAPIFNIPQLLLPMHIMLLELIIDPTCSIVFEGEPAEAYIMEQPPRKPSEPLLTKNLLIKVLLQGLTMFLATFIPFHYFVDAGISVEEARSFSLMVLIISNVTLVLVNRSNTQYITHLFKEKGNKTRLLINSLALVMLFGIVYIPFLQGFFKATSLGLTMALGAIILGFISTAWWEVVKFFQNKKSQEENIEIEVKG